MVKLLLLLFAFLIGFASLWYTNTLVKKLEAQERQKIELWASATRQLSSPEFTGDLNFLLQIIQDNTTIPVILTDDEGHIISSRNLDSAREDNSEYLFGKLDEMKSENEVIVLEYYQDRKMYLYYENSTLLNQLRIYPSFQIAVIGLFLFVSYFAFNYSQRSEQNKVWAGMSKETAHQLGTPISSLIGWMDYLKESGHTVPQRVIDEMDHDLKRLELITERFSKIGSEPVLELHNLYDVLHDSVYYIDSRTSDRVSISIIQPDLFKGIKVDVNVPLFAWVIENLCKNAVDAMEGEGSIRFELVENGAKVIFDIVDTGKGIPKNDFKTVFKPGFTTKARGWGLGLSLAKRIVENYHRGRIYVKWSELNKGTRFRIELKSH